MNSTLRFFARHVPGRRGMLAAFVALAVLVGALLAAALAVFAATVRCDAIRAADERVLLWFAQRRTPPLDIVMDYLTRLGDGIVVITLAVVAATLLILTTHRALGVVLLAAVIGAQLLNNALKAIFARPRPDIVEWATHVASPSFPSGHAMSAIATYGALAWAISRLEVTPAMRRVTWGIAAILIAGIGTSRVYLGVHYASDVLAGFLAGAAWLLFMTWVREMWGIGEMEGMTELIKKGDDGDRGDGGDDGK